MINKTNQFNLNGLRIGEGEWRRLLEDDETILTVASYRDKFGPLGKVPAEFFSGSLGTGRGSRVMSHWVMSCRAFSRRLEHHTLDALFHSSDAEEIEFAFEATQKNQPLREFFDSLGISADPPVETAASRVLCFLERPRNSAASDLRNLTKEKISKNE